MRRCRLSIGIFCGSLVLLSLLTGCVNTDNPLQNEANSQPASSSDVKLVKPGIESAKEFDISYLNLTNASGLAKTAQRASNTNGFGITSDEVYGNDAWFYGTGTNDGKIEYGRITIGFDPTLSQQMVGTYTQEEVDMLKNQLKWCVDYYNENSNTSVKFVYSDNNYWIKVYFTNFYGGHASGDVYTHHPMDKIDIGLPVVHDGMNNPDMGSVNGLRYVIMHEMTHLYSVMHIDEPVGDLVPGTPDDPELDPNTITWSKVSYWSWQPFNGPVLGTPVLTKYDRMALHYSLDNRYGLNNGLDFDWHNNKTDGTNWKNFVNYEYDGDIWTTGSDNLEWIYSSPSDALLPSGSFDNDAVMSGRIMDNQQTWIGIKFNTQRDGTQLHFKYKLDSEPYYDFFEVHYWIGGRATTRIYRMSGNVGWNDLTLALPSAVDCRVIFFYTKDGSVSSGSDRVYIDHPYLSN